MRRPRRRVRRHALDAERWNAIAHDDPTKYAVADGALKVTTTAGEIYQASTGRRPAAPAGGRPRRADWVLETKLTNTLDGGYSQGGILAYGDDNNYVKINAISDEGNARVNRLEMRSEVGGTVRERTGAIRRSRPRRRPARSGCG